MIGTLSLMVTNTFSGIVSCYISNGGYSTVYYGLDDYGWLWYFLQWPVIYIYEDYLTYWIHRIYHWPWLYVNFHKLHHKYKQPTAFSVTAIHPVEILSIQMILCTPLILFPIHWSKYWKNLIEIICLTFATSSKSFTQRGSIAVPTPKLP